MSKLGCLVWRWVFESGDAKRLAKQVQDLSDLSIKRDLPYIADGDRGHLFDIYRLPDAPSDAPVMINIHGGGLFASYKEVNVNSNYEMARKGYTVVSLSYRRIPETTTWHQVCDVMAAMRYLEVHAAELGLNLDRCYLTGDSAGALLALFVLCLHGSEQLASDFGIQASGIRFSAAGLISIMLDTQRKDLMRAINDRITGPLDRGAAYERYLLDPASMLDAAALPPIFQVTSAEDLIQKDSLKLEALLESHGVEHEMMNFAKGTERELVHVFAVGYPMYPESQEVFSAMDAFFKAHE